MKRRTRGELITFDDDDIGPAVEGQVVGDRRAADASADDDYSRIVSHGRRGYAPLGRFGTSSDH